MAVVPPAIVERPHRFPPPLRRAIVVLLVATACFLTWKLVQRWLHRDETRRMEVRHDVARLRIGNALDALFERQLEADTSTVVLHAELAATDGLGANHSAESCAAGFQDAFDDILGPGAIPVATSSIGEPAAPLALTGTISPSGRAFRMQGSPDRHPGITLRGELTFLGRTVHVIAQPATEIEVMHDGWSREPTAAEVAASVTRSTCKEAGYTLLEELTAWRRPVPPRRDLVEDCQHGFDCRASAEALEATDAPTATGLYAWVCVHDDDDAACVRAADLAAALPKRDDPNHGKARVAVEMACTREAAGACEAAGRLALLPLDDGKAPSRSQLSEALVLYLRACDLGARHACTAASTLLEDTPFADAAPLLAGARSVRSQAPPPVGRAATRSVAEVRSRTLGTLFALRWGQWTQLDSGQPTAWATRLPAHLPRGALVTRFAADHLPAGLTAPPGATVVYAIALDGSRGARCERCLRSRDEDRALGTAIGCICALSPRR